MSRREDSAGTVLVVDDEAFSRRFFETILEEQGYGCVTTDTAEDFLHRIDEQDLPDLIILDVRLPDGNGLELLKLIRSREILTPIILITAYGSIDDAVSAMKMGAFDFFTKPFDDTHKIKISIKNALEHHRLSNENRMLRAQLYSRAELQNLVGVSPKMQQVYEVIRKAAAVDSHILVEGESGTGKDLVAEAIHNLSKRYAKPFLPINCAALPEQLLESTLFGYEKGAFTGASKITAGFFEEAHGGTLFLDEIAEAPMTVQAKILRAVEEGAIYRVGSTKRIPTNVRLIFATNKDLGQEVLAGRFRKDLYYRINIIRILLPPLDERREDIPLLVSHFTEKICTEMGVQKKTITEDALSYLLKRSWPGNVRELKNLLARVMALHSDLTITAQDLARYAPDTVEAETEGLFAASYEEAKKVFETRYFEKLISEMEGNLSLVAERSGVHISTLYRRIKALGIRAIR